jgi:hypothetical protein
MKKNCFSTISAILLCLMLAGCDQSGVNKGAFDSAPPDVKQAWEKGLAASTANDYVTASQAFNSLLHGALQADQLVSVQAALSTLNRNMNAAAAKGDPAAQKALETLQGGLRGPARPGAGAPH